MNMIPKTPDASDMEKHAPEEFAIASSILAGSLADVGVTAGAAK
jgi:hypothetical protein